MVVLRLAGSVSFMTVTLWRSPRSRRKKTPFGGCLLHLIATACQKRLHILWSFIVCACVETGSSQWSLIGVVDLISQLVDVIHVRWPSNSVKVKLLCKIALHLGAYKLVFTIFLSQLSLSERNYLLKVITHPSHASPCGRQDLSIINIPTPSGTLPESNTPGWGTLPTANTG